MSPLPILTEPSHVRPLLAYHRVHAAFPKQDLIGTKLGSDMLRNFGQGVGFGFEPLIVTRAPGKPPPETPNRPSKPSIRGKLTC